MRASNMSEESKRRFAAQKRERKLAAKRAYMIACRMDFDQCVAYLMGGPPFRTFSNWSYWYSVCRPLTDEYALQRIAVLLRRKLVTRHNHPHAVWLLTQVVQSRPFIFADQPEIIGWLRENM